MIYYDYKEWDWKDFGMRTIEEIEKQKFDIAEIEVDGDKQIVKVLVGWIR